MKFAVVEGERRKAEPHLSGKCPVCSAAVIAKCGPVRVPHWAHQGTRDCDHWWEPETPWHRAWKDHFPEKWQEISHPSESGAHRADVKTESGVVLEFQHSFYRKMVWVVDGLRRERDQKHFFMSINGRSLLKPKPLTYSVSSNESALLRDWMDSRVPVYFDFEDGTLWRLEPRSPEGKAHLSPVTKASFLNHYLRGKGLKGVNYLAVLARIQQAARARPLMDFERSMANQRARQPRF